VKVAIGLIGLENFFGGDFAALAQFVRRAEERGLDMVTCTDHVIMGEHVEKYPYGPFPMPPEWPWYEPITLLAAIASATQRVLLGTGIVIAPLRPAALLAKQLATLDVISGGRLRIGLGVGWQREEYEACGVPWDGRFGHMMEQVAVCRRLWGEAPSTFNGKHVRYERLHSRPFPVQGARMPVDFGLAPSERNFERIAELGDGWIPMEQDTARLGEAIARLRVAFAKRGRQASELNVRVVPATQLVDGRPDLAATLARVPEYVAAGATEIEIHPIGFCASPADLDAVVDALVAVKQGARG
jgi:probable F420-dependent oxidoreductase